MCMPRLFRKSRSDESSSIKRKSQMPKDLCLVKQGFTIAGKIGEGSFSVYQIFTKVENKSYVLKKFPCKDNKPDSFYKNEARFVSLKHPNVINMICANDLEDTSESQEDHGVFSSIIMEYAPHGDFLNLIMRYGDYFDDKLIRTYFRQLIEGLEYLHGHDIAHLDLKPENLLVGQNYDLKIIDFDVSYMRGDKDVLSNGTLSYRCPEMTKLTKRYSQPKIPSAADIYSAGILLFILKSRGVNPFFEDREEDDVDFLELMNKNNPEFWKKHCELERKPQNYYDKDLIDLYNGMTRPDAVLRYTVKEIKETKWYNGPIYKGVQLERKMKEILNLKPNAYRM